MEQLIIKKDGKLFQTKWVYDEQKEEGSYQTFDVTENSFNYLYEYCELDKDVTLKDIFLLLNNELELYNLLLRNWTSEIVKEGLSDQEVSDKESDVEYLELYYFGEYRRFEKDEPYTLHGAKFPSFHGIGYELQEDRDGWKKGTRVPYSLSFQSANKLINLPVRLNKEFSVSKDDYVDNTHTDVFIKFDAMPYTLFDILYGIMWELSFYGPPAKRDEEGQKIKDIMDGYKKDLDKYPKV